MWDKRARSKGMSEEKSKEQVVMNKVGARRGASNKEQGKE